MTIDTVAIRNSVTQKRNERKSSSTFTVRSYCPIYLLAKDMTAPAETGDVVHPIRVFKIASDDDFKAFQHVIIPAFRELEWDEYDVRQAERQFIESANFDLKPEDHTLLLSYYRGEIGHDEIAPLLENMTIADAEKILVPYRKKACRVFNATKQEDGWLVEKLPEGSVLQNVAKNDYRSIERKYKSIPENIIDHSVFKDLVSHVIHMTKESRPTATTMRLTAWMMSCYTWTNGPTTNSPEGTHQDGSDFIVSAYVIERTNVVGGSSRIFHASDLKQPIMKFLLSPGEGLFQADASSPLWHDVTHIEIADERQPFGVRSLIGFDVWVTG